MSGGPDAATAVRRGVRLFNQGRYFTAQQVFEESWQATPGPERSFLEALVQLAAGMHLRTRRGAMQGAEHLLGSSTCAGLGLKLRNITPDYKLCSHVAFRGALGYRGTLRCRR